MAERTPEETIRAILTYCLDARGIISSAVNQFKDNQSIALLLEYQIKEYNKIIDIIDGKDME